MRSAHGAILHGGDAVARVGFERVGQVVERVAPRAAGTGRSRVGGRFLEHPGRPAGVRIPADVAAAGSGVSASMPSSVCKPSELAAIRCPETCSQRDGMIGGDGVEHVAVRDGPSRRAANRRSRSRSPSCRRGSALAVDVLAGSWLFHQPFEVGPHLTDRGRGEVGPERRWHPRKLTWPCASMKPGRRAWSPSSCNPGLPRRSAAGLAFTLLTHPDDPLPTHRERGSGGPSGSGQIPVPW